MVGQTFPQMATLRRASPKKSFRGYGGFLDNDVSEKKKKKALSRRD